MRRPTFLYLALAVLSGPLLLAGCDSGSDEPAADNTADASSADVTTGGDHSHTSGGPHGGSLIDLGHGDYHAELVRDDHVPGVAVYLLDSSAEQAAFVEADYLTINLLVDGKPEQFQLAASPQSSDPQGKSSRFVSGDEKLRAYLDAEDLEGRLLVKIQGRSYTGDLHQIHGRHTHSHTGDDALTWRREGIRHQGYQFALGHHGEDLHAGHAVEPAVGITRDGKPVADAQVFNSLLAADGQTVLAKESRTVYEPPTADEPAHYAQGNLTVPRDVDRLVIRYRIVLPRGDGETSYDVPVEVAD